MTIDQRRHGRVRAGYTLLEVLIATTVVSLLLATGVDLFITTLRIASRSNAQVSAMSRGGVVMERIMRFYRESYSVALPTDASGFVPPQAGTAAASYVTTDGSAAALQITMPSAAAVSVVNSVGAIKTSGVDFPMTYTKSAGTTMTFYRSDTAGKPAPNNGQCLWECGAPPGQTALPATGQRFAMLAQTPSVAANAADAVVFARAPGTLPVVAFRIVASDYSLINGQQNSESNTATVVGKWVLSRNHS